jgi:membrane-bound serine protease (ClpP class)
MLLLRGFLALLCTLAAALALTGTAAGADPPRVLAVEFENDINPVTADYLTGAIDKAEDEDYDAVVILMDTPGGLDSAMRDIIKKELDSTVPVVVYVSPQGSRAASAGVFITMAADVAAMAPNTNIGSSTPISTSGGNIPSDLRRKVINDAAAYIRGLAETHGRNADWAEEAVRQASNLTAEEALDQNVVDVVAPDLPTLLNDIDGMRRSRRASCSTQRARMSRRSTCRSGRGSSTPSSTRTSSCCFSRSACSGSPSSSSIRG